ncbi:excisionase family DNA-binding protein [Pseudonocardia endophytica]|uniref:excisionase family DNA-binding protein n=1 Tax=Pseudonocardia endophytica TaxID=401976 RepID=UPI00105175F1|nr:excisionase family DNA-binding protein [Pseudonocardia endophytica]
MAVRRSARPDGSSRHDAVPKALYSVDEAAVLLSQSRSRLYELLRSGRLRSVHEGRTRLIPAGAINAYVELLEHEAAAEPHPGPRR